MYVNIFKPKQVVVCTVYVGYVYVFMITYGRCSNYI